MLLGAKQNNLLKLVVVAVIVVACLLAIPLSGCQSTPSGQIEVRVIVTQDFGNELLLDKLITLNEGSTAMDALQKVAMVETKSGGGFVKAIKGIASKAPKDWFFYINGISANVGALDYKLYDGDVEHWDFHDWSFHAFVPAIVGDFPQPFLNGYRGETLPTIVVYAEGFQGAAQDLANNLGGLGVGNVSVHTAAEISSQDKERFNLILLGTNDFDLISEMNGKYNELGFYAYFEGDEVKVCDSQGRVTQRYPSCGLIQATQSLWNSKGVGACENVVWIVSGTDEAQIRNAVDVMINHHDNLRYAWATVIINGQVNKIPLQVHIFNWWLWIGVGVVITLLIALVILIRRRKRLVPHGKL